ncbi:MAG: hypothetical protein AB7U81_03465 [Thiohalomonadaceae bacterium]
MLFIIIVGIALSGIMAVYVRSVSASADPVIRQRTIAVGSAYMDEILRKRWNENSPMGGGCVVTGGGSCVAEAASTWSALTAYGPGDHVAPTSPSTPGCRFLTNASGTSGAVEPVWPTSLGATVADGNLTWTCVALDAVAIGAEAGEARSAYDDIDDYDGISETPTHQTGGTMPGYDGYTVAVDVEQVAVFAGVAAEDTRRITVSVTNPLGETFRLQAVRLNF